MNGFWLTTQPEGQFLERKSCYDRTGASPRPRPVHEVVRDVAEALVAMANADGGTIVLGIEDDGAISGVPERYHPDAIRRQIQDLVRPRLHFRFSEVPLEGQRVWVFETVCLAGGHRQRRGAPGLPPPRHRHRGPPV